ncbi:uncharacterized protein M437DRAFT_77916 [Aureobasidium melanogenum CBS 110374]|uniref:Aminoglycoside phosphotransferase domain-containing protein n=1 Tax=Aureobasidium melanogenum (strain CBS 110374) TaxID=1043003 RepID=A0A074VQ63_AURM1|nr:uncharacterized protein M437DRAFT_77916 [Aureobasidium melanogenum CBS 110374]KEQ59812.1 hypothetical protein M437DRAFT_77916 [Aureobasidium melanogenum CBS 110374]
METSDAKSLSTDSSHSTTPNSTSTYKYSHESFETFRKKVGALAHDIGSKSLENIVVLRIPRFAEDTDPLNEDIRNQYSILDATAKLGLRVPRVLAYDCTSNNALGMPFSLQTRLEGQALDLTYGDLTITERLSTASELVRLLAAIENMKFPNPGRLECSGAVPDRHGIGKVDDTSPMDILQVQGFGVGVGSSRSKPTSPSPTSLRELLSTQFDAWIQHKLADDPTETFDAGMFQRLKKIYSEMDELGFFEDRASLNSNVLYHWDLEPRNILIERNTTVPSSDASEEHHVQITGVLDWDDALSVPPILARKPPIWLWDFSDDETLPSSVLAHYYGDMDLIPPELYSDARTRLSKEDLQVKKFFESEITTKLYGDTSSASREAYLDDAYGRGRWIRRLWRFALEGFYDSQHISRYEDFDKDWTEYRKTQVIA